MNQKALEIVDLPFSDDNELERPFIHIQGVTKKFDEFTAVNDVDLKIYKGELFSLLGGSGCGKTTLLRMLSGFEIPTAGRIVIDGIDMTEMPAYDRPVNMMFQSYALFPHMNVAKNIAYGLKRDGLPRKQIDDRVEEMLDLVQLNEFAHRKPEQLSGGQRQRVALARALAKHPKVLLLDEPLGALDKKLREQTQFELMNIQQRLGTTFVVVTHDQEEAMTLSSRLAVMDRGQVIQKGTPREVYEFPKNRFIAEFVGSINIFECTVKERIGDNITVSCPTLGRDFRFVNNQFPARAGNNALIAIRPEKIHIQKEPNTDPDFISIAAQVREIGYLGNQTIFRLELRNGALIKVMMQNMRHSSERSIDIDDRVYLSWEAHTAVLLAD